VLYFAFSEKNSDLNAKKIVIIVSPCFNFIPKFEGVYIALDCVD